MANIIQEIPLSLDTPNQTQSILLNNQSVSFNFYTRRSYFFTDIFIDNTAIAHGVKCTHLSYLNQYLTSLIGYLFFFCEDGLDPTYDRLSTCHLLYTDYDALDIYYKRWLATNLESLKKRIGV